MNVLLLDVAAGRRADLLARAARGRRARAARRARRSTRRLTAAGLGPVAARSAVAAGCPQPDGRAA